MQSRGRGSIRRSHDSLWLCGTREGSGQLGNISILKDRRSRLEALTAAAYLVSSPILEVCLPSRLERFSKGKEDFGANQPLAARSSLSFFKGGNSL